MKLNKLTLTNFCQHEQKTIDISRGLSGILGPNGSGKSNLVQGIIYAITGSLPNTLDRYIRQGSDSTCCVELEFTSDLTDKTYSIKRSIKPRRTELTCLENRVVLRKTKDVDAFLTDVLKIDFNIVRNVLTVAQEDFVSFFRSSNANRADVLYRLFGFSELKTARESFRQILLDTRPTDEFVQKLKAYQEMLATEERALEPLSSLPLRADVQKEYEEFSAQMKFASEQLSLYKTLEFFEQQRGTLQSKRQAIQAELGTIPNADDETLIQKHEQILQQLGSALPTIEHTYLTYISGLPLFQQQVRQAQEALRGVPVPLSDEEYMNLLNRQAVLQKEVQDLMQFQATGCCPTCGQPFPNLTTKLNSVNDDFYKVKLEVREATSQRSKYEDLKNNELRCLKSESVCYNVARQLLTSREKAGTGLEQSFISVLKNMPDSSQPLDRWVADVKREINVLKVLYQQTQAAYSQLTAHRERRTQLNFELKTIEAQLTELETNMPSLTGAMSRAEAVEFLNRAEKQRQEYIRLFSSLDSADAIRKRISSLKIEISRLEQLAKQDEQRATLRSDVTTACDVLHPDAFPKILMLSLLETLTTAINGCLTAFNAPFSVTIDDSSTELLCQFQTNNQTETFAASELSGGQKMLLAISWRLALHNAFAEEESCGFLILDEPTNHLDSENVQNLLNVMQTVKQTARERNLQIMVITHEKMLEPLFDSVIQLG